MRVMPGDRPDLLQPVPVLAGSGLAHVDLHSGGNKDAIDPGIGRGCLQQGLVRRGPGRRHAALVGGADCDRADLFPFCLRQVKAARRQHPDIGIQPDLVAGMARGHRSPAWLADVADVKPGPANLLRRDAQLRQEGDHFGLAEVATPAETHHLPARARVRHGDHPRPAAAGIAADRHRRLGRGCIGRAEQTVGQLFCGGGRGKSQGQQDYQDTTHAVSPSPFGLTQSSRIRPRANRRIKGVIPQG